MEQISRRKELSGKCVRRRDFYDSYWAAVAFTRWRGEWLENGAFDARARPWTATSKSGFAA